MHAHVLSTLLFLGLVAAAGAMFDEQTDAPQRASTREPLAEAELPGEGRPARQAWDPATLAAAAEAVGAVLPELRFMGVAWSRPRTE